MGKFLCWFGIHDWGKWSDKEPSGYRMYPWQQLRTCKRCNFVNRTLV